MISRKKETTPTQKKPSKKRKPASKKLLLLIVVLEIALLAALVETLNITSIDNRFIRAMDHGVVAGWQLENGEQELKDSAKTNDTSFIDCEYEAVKAFKGRAFRDEKLGALAADYIKALDGCREAAEKYDPDRNYDKFWGKFSQYYGRRIDAIYKIYRGDFGLRLEGEGIKDRKNDLMVSAWALEKSGTIEFSRKIEEKKPENGEGDEQTDAEETDVVCYTATVNNDSGFDLEYINIEVELYDEDNNLIETTTAYADNIKKGKEFKLKCSQTTDTKVASYRVSSIICSIAPKDMENAAVKDNNKEDKKASDESGKVIQDKAGQDN